MLLAYWNLTSRVRRAMAGCLRNTHRVGVAGQLLGGIDKIERFEEIIELVVTVIALHLRS
jgi:hypothetical protein